MHYSADDVPIWRENYKVLVKDQLNISGLYMIGYANHQKAAAFLDNHFHANMEFVVLIKGRQQYNAEEKSHMLYGKEMFATWPHELHGGTGYKQDICEYIWFQIDLSSPDHFLGLTPPHSEYLYQQFQNYRQRRKKVSTKDIMILKEAFDGFSSRETSGQIRGHCGFLQFVAKNICTSDEEPEKEGNDEDIQEVVSYIHRNLQNDLNIEILAQYCGLSTSRLEAKFKEQIGVTPHAYINALKVDSAKIYLKDPNRSITEIAFLFNFSSSNHFAAVFKKHTGFTPTQFRKQRCSSIY